MATTQKAAAPAKKSGFGGVKDAWIILVICAIAGYSVWYFVMGKTKKNKIYGNYTEGCSPSQEIGLRRC